MYDERIKLTQLERMMTARQVAEFLDVSISSIRRWSKSGELKVYKVGVHGQMRFRVEDVLRYLEVSGTRLPADTSQQEALPLHRNGQVSTGKEAVVQQEEVLRTQTEPVPITAQRHGDGRMGITSFIESTAEVFALFDANFKLMGINPAAERLLGLSEEDVVGKSILDFAPDLKRMSRNGAYRDIVQKGESLLVDCLILHTGSGDKSLNVRIFGIGKGLGMIVGEAVE